MMGFSLTASKVALLSDPLIFLSAENTAVENEQCSETESRKPRFNDRQYW